MTPYSIRCIETKADGTLHVSEITSYDHLQAIEVAELLFAEHPNAIVQIWDMYATKIYEAKPCSDLTNPKP